MPGEPSISVIIPSYNSARWVAEAVESALAQTLTPAQIIVIDDGSKDDTAMVLKPYVDCGAVKYLFQENRGVAAARNTGIAHATTELIAFLDSDDVWHPRKLELQSAALGQRPELGMLGTAVFDWPGAVPEAPNVAGNLDVDQVRWDQLIVRNYFTTSSLLVRQCVLDNASALPFDVNLRGPEDYDLWLRIAERHAVGNLTARLTGYREVVGSLGKQVKTMEEGVERVLAKAGQRGAWNRPGGGHLRRKAYAYFYCTCGYMHGAAGNQGLAASRILKSMFSYPLPFRRTEVSGAWTRPKLLAVSVLRMARLKAPERAAHNAG